MIFFSTLHTEFYGSVLFLYYKEPGKDSIICCCLHASVFFLCSSSFLYVADPLLPWEAAAAFRNTSNWSAVLVVLPPQGCGWRHKVVFRVLMAVSEAESQSLHLYTDPVLWRGKLVKPEELPEKGKKLKIFLFIQFMNSLNTAAGEAGQPAGSSLYWRFILYFHHWWKALSWWFIHMTLMTERSVGSAIILGHMVILYCL